MNNLLPIFINLEESPCLVVGGGKIALQKIMQLLDSKALVTVVAPEIDELIIVQPVKLLNRCYKSDDIDKKKLIIAATNNKEINQKIYKDSQRRGIPVNVVDQSDYCSFYMGSVYQDGDLKVAISTNGKCPSFGMFIRDHIKNISTGVWGRALNDLAIKRELVIKTLSCYTEKKEVIGRLVKNSLKKIVRTKNVQGKVFLIGAGPGDPELITIKGLKAI